MEVLDKTISTSETLLWKMISLSRVNLTCLVNLPVAFVSVVGNVVVVAVGVIVFGVVEGVVEVVVVGAVEVVVVVSASIKCYIKYINKF